MFNLLVAGHSDMWETQPSLIGLDCFKEYSGHEAGDTPVLRYRLENVY